VAGSAHGRRSRPGLLPSHDAQKREAILKFYENAALAMYNGYAKQMAGYAKSPDAAKKRLAGLFQQAASPANINPASC